MTSIEYPRSITTGLGDHLRRRSTVILLSLGILAATLHASFRFPLGLPGHHGLEWMALLVIARHFSSYRWAATLVALGAAGASTLPVLGFHNPITPALYLLPGLCLDLLFMARSTVWLRASWLIGLLAGTAFATKPVLQWLALDLFNSQGQGALIKHGLVYVVAMHFAFGFTGGSIGNALWRIGRAPAR